MRFRAWTRGDDSRLLCATNNSFWKREFCAFQRRDGAQTAQNVASTSMCIVYRLSHGSFINSVPLWINRNGCSAGANTPLANIFTSGLAATRQRKWKCYYTMFSKRIRMKLLAFCPNG